MTEARALVKLYGDKGVFLPYRSILEREGEVRSRV